MNEALENALEVTSASIADIQLQVNKRIQQFENYNSKCQNQRNTMIKSVRERQIVIAEELILLSPTLNYNTLGIAEPTQGELEAIANKINVMSDKDRTNIMFNINKYVVELLASYNLSNDPSHFGWKFYLESRLEQFELI